MKLKKPSGHVTHLAEGDPAEASDRLVRPCVFVHSGPDGDEIVFQSSDGEIKFDEARIQKIVDAQNAKTMALANDYGGIEKMPIGAFIPNLDQHEDDSTIRINGRVTGLVRFEKRDVPGIGPNCACVVGEITFLGEDVVKRVKDGRIYHLSIGIDEETNTFSEVSSVIEPAAGGAMVLKKVNSKGEKTMAKKNLAARKEAHAKRLAGIAKIQEGVKELSAKLVTTKTSVELTKKENTIRVRLAGAMKAGKLTPAEFKKIDVKKLAKGDDTSVNSVLEVIEAMEPKVLPGQAGSTNAADFNEIGKNLEEKQKKNLKAEVRKDLKKLGARLKDGEDKDDKKMAEKPEPEKEMAEGYNANEQMMKHMAMMGEAIKSGDMKKCAEVHGEMAKCMNAPGEVNKDMSSLSAEESDAQAKDLEGKVDELTTNMARLAGMVDEMMSAEKDEGHDLESEEGEGADLEKDKEQPKDDKE